MSVREILERALSQGVEATPSDLRLAVAIEQALAALRTPAGRRTLREALDAPLEFDEEREVADALMEQKP